MPTVSSVADYLNALIQADVLTPEQAEPIRSDPVTFADPTLAARQLVRLGHITIFQAQQVFQGRGRQLTLGKYLLLDKIGEGGMGLVYKARDKKLGRIVALKVIRGEYAQHPQALRRFQREARAAAPLAHAHMVTLYDADQIGNQHYLALEYVPGQDLGQLLKRHGPLPVAQACDFIRQAALGLHHAHAAGLVHRDVKPANLLVMPPDAAATSAGPWGTVKVSDLGLARLAAAAESQTTRDGAMIGTVDYMAPEQAKDSKTADARADLYSLGCTLFQLLTGRLPFEGENVIEKMLKHQQEPAPDVRTLNPDVPAPVADLIQRLLAKQPEDRPRSAAEVAEALVPHSRDVVGTAGWGHLRDAAGVALEPTIAFGNTPTPDFHLQPAPGKAAGTSAPKATGRKPAPKPKSRPPSSHPSIELQPPRRWILVAAVVVGVALVVIISWIAYRPRAPGGLVDAKGPGGNTQPTSRPAEGRGLAGRPVLPPPGWISLWNGRDLSGWEVIVSQPEGVDSQQLIRVDQIEGEPALVFAADLQGTLTTTSPYEDFTLRAEYRWGPESAPAQSPRQSGIRYLCHGRRSKLRGGWMAGCGLELKPEGSGRLRLDSVDLIRFVPAAEHEPIRDLAPPRWNEVEIIVQAQPATVVHNVNGRTVAAAQNLHRVTLLGADRETPLRSGKIQLVADRSEIAFRRLWLRTGPQ